MFTKLFSSITTSSIWNEDNNTRIVWITMLAMSNKHGYVSASIGGLAHEARVTREECEKALDVLKSPDKDSRSKEFDGRRIEIVDGGFQLLNHQKYRAIRSEQERKEYMKAYMKDYRARTKTVNNGVNNVSECKPRKLILRPDAEADADTDINTLPPSEAEMAMKGLAKKAKGLSPIVRGFMALFRDGFRAQTGETYDDQGIKDREGAEKLLSNGMTPESLMAHVKAGWKSDDPWIRKQFSRICTIHLALPQLKMSSKPIQLFRDGSKTR